MGIKNIATDAAMYKRLIEAFRSPPAPEAIFAGLVSSKSAKIVPRETERYTDTIVKIKVMKANIVTTSVYLTSIILEKMMTSSAIINVIRN